MQSVKNLTEEETQQKCDTECRGKSKERNGKKRSRTCSKTNSEDVNDDHAEKKPDDPQSDADSINDDSEEKFSELIKRLIAQTQKDSEEIENCKSLVDASQSLDSKQGSFRNIGTSPVSGDSQRIKETQTIVILKPEPIGLELGSSPGTHDTCKKAKSGRSGSSFILSRIRRKLKSSPKKNPCNADALSSDMSQHSCLGEEIETSSRRHVSAEDSTINGSEDSKKSMCGIYIAARKHLSEMLAEGDAADVDSPDKEVPRILGKILSLPEFSTPENSPRVTLAHEFVGHQIEETPNIQQCSSEDSTRYGETAATSSGAGGLDTGDEEKTVLDSLCEAVSSSVVHQDEYVDEKKHETHDEHEQTQPLEKVVSECQDNAGDVLGKSSPVSVLEPFFTDDETSPNSSRLSSAERRLQPRCIRFNEPDSPRSEKDNEVKTRMDDKDLALGYIQAVVKSSELNWEELLVRSFYLEQVLEEALVDDIEFYPTNFCTDKRLLFDCINEVLMEFCGHDGPWISLAKPAVRFGPDMENVAEVVQEEVYWHLLPLPSPHTLDQIVRKDLVRTGNWMDLCFDIGCIGSQTGEIILDELLQEIISSCTDLS
ncbi:Phosphatidylinositol N-acetyglucosaminlytransferase subunit P-like protein [Hirschfeldia incana]|nr:Phosphatidylinositol N-acetyglucosaminlytransferase subunit P-like protein [Hirschfeldia incana]